MPRHAEHRHWQDREQQHRRHRHHRRPEAEDAFSHWVGTAAILAPVLIGEFVKDAETKWRFTRVTSVVAAVLAEGLYSHQTYRNRERTRKALKACELACEP